MSMDDLLVRYEYAKSLAIARWLPQVSEAYAYACPGRYALGVFFQYLNLQTRLDIRLRDVTTIQAVKARANNLTQLLIPFGREWANFKFTLAAKQKYGDEITQDLISTTQAEIFDILNSAGIEEVAQASLIDATIVGGAVWAETISKHQPLKLSALPGFCVIPEYYTDGVSRAAWVHWQVSGGALCDLLIDAITNNATTLNLPKLNEAINQMRAVPMVPYWIVRTVRYEPDVDPKNRWRIVSYAGIPNVDAPKVQEGSIVITGTSKAGSPDGNPYAKGSQLIQFSDIRVDYQPLLYFREAVLPGDVVGRGVVMDILPIIIELNTTCAYYYEGLPVAMNPPMMANLQAISTHSMRKLQGALLPSEARLEQVQIRQNFDTFMGTIKYLQQQINSNLSVNPIGDLNQPVRTATEVSGRQDAALTYTAIGSGRLMQEFSAKLFNLGFALGLKYKLFTYTEVLQKMYSDQDQFIFNYVNPLADIDNNNVFADFAQKNSFIQQTYGAEGVVAAFDQVEAMDLLKRVSKPAVAKVFVDSTTFAQTIAHAAGGGNTGVPNAPTPAISANAPTAPTQQAPVPQSGMPTL